MIARRGVFLSTTALVGCAALIGIEDTSDLPPDLGSSDAARDGHVDGEPAGDGGDPDSTAPVSPCPTLRGPPMVLVSSGFCIDATEITRGDYAAFMAADASTVGQATECAFNTSYAPVGWPFPAEPAADLALPAGVDWCDAVAYCRWAGKRLCGSRADGGVIPIAQGSDAAASEWAAACSGNGARAYAYGNTYEASRCNGAQFDAGRVLPVGERPLCQGGDPGVFDMSGNAWEWDSTCELDDAGRPKMCGQRGGSFTDQAGLLVCALTNYQALTLRQDTSGFRCCASKE